MKNIQAWGFLVSRNQYLDYRTVVAPSFMCQAGASNIFAKATEGDLTEKGSALYGEIHNSKVGNLTLIFRVIEATAEDTGIAGNGVLKDSFGREIYFIEGIVFKEIMPDVVVTQENIEETHKQLVEYYREFWDCTAPNSAISSEPFTLQADKSLDDCLDYRKLKECVVDVKPKAILEKITLVEEINNIKKLTHGVIKFWNLRTRKEIRSIKASDLPINSLAFSPDGQTLVSGSDDYSIKLWNAKTGREDCMLGQHSAPVNSVAFSPDGNIIASGSDDCKIKIWKLKNQSAISVLSEHANAVTSVAFSPDGQTIVSSSKDCTIRLWQHI